ncbi:hypothetical protein lerEdw1_002489 [Lerista edwardsae]|nr:hypothetical protein lerEdw1_002489 [Lerista edwardsae]
MNCSGESRRRLQRLFSRLWQELRGGQAAPNGSVSSWWPPGGASPGGPSEAAAAQPAGEGEDDAYLYILLIMIFYGCLAGGLILAYTRSRKLESKHDPYHLYIERDWAPAAAAPREAAAHAERRSSGESELL